MKVRVSASVFCLATIVAGIRAQADIAPPDVSACSRKAQGDPCLLPSSCDARATGGCQNEICSRVNYKASAIDGAPPVPETVTSLCLTCVSHTDTVLRTHPDSWSTTCVPSLPPTMTTIATVTGSATATDTRTASTTFLGTDTTTATNSESSGDGDWCSVGRGTAASKIAPWLMAGTFSLLFLLARRRRRP